MITAPLLRSWSACWDDAAIEKFADGRSEMSPRDIANDKRIKVDDRLWVVCRSLWYLDERAARLFAIETALTVAQLAGDEDDEAQFRGLMNDLIAAEDLDPAAWSAARNGAWSAAWSAAMDAARNGAWSAAWSAAMDAARNGAMDAAWSAAMDAAMDAARSADLKRSLARAIEWLGDYADGWEEDAEEVRSAA